LDVENRFRVALFQAQKISKRRIFMSIIRFDPWKSRFPSLWEELDWPEMTDVSRGLNIYEEDKDVIVEAAVPGINPENVEVTVDKGTITIRGEEEEKEEDKKKRKYYRSERKTSFAYQAVLPCECDEAKAQAESADGVLKVRIPKAKAAKPKAIKVSVKKEIKKK
jgi:HSP20 family protein